MCEKFAQDRCTGTPYFESISIQFLGSEYIGCGKDVKTTAVSHKLLIY